MAQKVPVNPHEALAVYAEPLVVRRRVLVLGDDATGLQARLTELGARVVVTLRPGEDAGDLRPAGFDLAVVPDLGAFEDPAAVVAVARRAVGEAGALLVAALNRDVGADAASRSFDYYELFDLVAHDFADVRMVAQVPFHGVALAELGRGGGAPPVTVDAQLVDDPAAPTEFLALASHRAHRLDPYVIVELPAPEAPAMRVDPLEAAAAELERLGVLDALRQELELERARAVKADSRAGELHERVAAAFAEVEAARSRLSAATEALEVERRRSDALEADVTALRAVAIAAESLEREVAARGRALVELSAEVEQARAAAQAGALATAQAAAYAHRAERAERALAQIEPELHRVAERQTAEIERLEEALRDRALAVRTLEVEVARRDRMVRELAETLGDQPSGVVVDEAAPAATPGATDDLLAADNARLRERLDAIALELARREAESHASSWAVAELERKLREATASAQNPPITSGGDDASRRDDRQRLAKALDEVDALRKALALEHEARVRAEAAAAQAEARSGPGVAVSSPTQS